MWCEHRGGGRLDLCSTFVFVQFCKAREFLDQTLDTSEVQRREEYAAIIGEAQADNDYNSTKRLTEKDDDAYIMFTLEVWYPIGINCGDNDYI